MHIQPIGSYEHLTALEPEWRDLYAREVAP